MHGPLLQGVNSWIETRVGVTHVINGIHNIPDGHGSSCDVFSDACSAGSLTAIWWPYVNSIPLVMQNGSYGWQRDPGMGGRLEWVRLF